MDVIPRYELRRAMSKGSVVRYALAALRGKTCTVKISDHKVTLRTKSTDLEVAVENLGKEFELPLSYLSQDFDGFVIDAGGYIGTSALMFASHLPHSKIISLEPSPENYRMLKENIRKYANITAINAALCLDKTKPRTLRDRGTGAWGYTIVDHPADAADAGALSSCEVVSMDQIIKDYGPNIGLMKLDIEGGEYELLQNSDDWLPHVEVLVIELHERIVPGIEDLFQTACSERDNFPLDGEKVMSVRRDPSAQPAPLRSGA